MTWAAALLLSAALSVLFPVLLLPIFLRSEPMPEGPLRDALRRTVADAGVAVRDIRLLHLGDWTPGTNAMVAGLGPTRRIYIGDTLSADAPDDEAVAETQLVLARELGHHVNGDPWRLLVWAAVSLAVGVAGGWAAVEGAVAGRRRGADRTAGAGPRVLAGHGGRLAAWQLVLSGPAGGRAAGAGGRRGRALRPRARAAGRPEPVRDLATPPVACPVRLPSEAGRADRASRAAIRQAGQD